MGAAFGASVQDENTRPPNAPDSADASNEERNSHANDKQIVMHATVEPCVITASPDSLGTHQGAEFTSAPYEAASGVPYHVEHAHIARQEQKTYAIFHDELFGKQSKPHTNDSTRERDKYHPDEKQNATNKADTHASQGARSNSNRRPRLKGTAAATIERILIQRVRFETASLGDKAHASSVSHQKFGDWFLTTLYFSVITNPVVSGAGMFPWPRTLDRQIAAQAVWHQPSDSRSYLPTPRGLGAKAPAAESNTARKICTAPVLVANVSTFFVNEAGAMDMSMYGFELMLNVNVNIDTNDSTTQAAMDHERSDALDPSRFSLPARIGLGEKALGVRRPLSHVAPPYSLQIIGKQDGTEYHVHYVLPCSQKELDFCQSVFEDNLPFPSVLVALVLHYALINVAKYPRVPNFAASKNYLVTELTLPRVDFADLERIQWLKTIISEGSPASRSAP
jgi:hypothetical protein